MTEGGGARVCFDEGPYEDLVLEGTEHHEAEPRAEVGGWIGREELSWADLQQVVEGNHQPNLGYHLVCSAARHLLPELATS